MNHLAALWGVFSCCYENHIDQYFVFI